MAEGKIRIKDIAKIAGVSATTVSNVIHGRTEKVSRKTRKRIEEILDEQEYAPSMGARILSGKSSGMIAVVVGKRQEWEQESEKLEEIIYVFLTIFLYLLKCPQSLILSALRAFCFCGKPHISRSIFLYFRYQAWLKSW